MGQAWTAAESHTSPQMKHDTHLNVRMQATLMWHSRGISGPSSEPQGNRIALLPTWTTEDCLLSTLVCPPPLDILVQIPKAVPHGAPFPGALLTTKGSLGVHECRGTTGAELFTGMARRTKSQTIPRKTCLSWDPDLNLLFAQATARPLQA